MNNILIVTQHFISISSRTASKTRSLPLNNVVVNQEIKTIVNILIQGKITVNIHDTKKNLKKQKTEKIQKNSTKMKNGKERKTWFKNNGSNKIKKQLLSPKWFEGFFLLF